MTLMDRIADIARQDLEMRLEEWICAHCGRLCRHPDPSTWCSQHEAPVCDACHPCGAGGL